MVPVQITSTDKWEEHIRKIKYADPSALATALGIREQPKESQSGNKSASNILSVAFM